MQENWQSLLKEVITSPAELLAELRLPASLLPAAQQSAKLFPLRVARGFVAHIQKANPEDPLLRQILPLDQEKNLSPGFSQDPLNERAVNPIPGLLHKYQGRVLLTLVGACAVNCRYCFRRHFPYQKNIPGGRVWQTILDYITRDTSIYEVILSGGDPLLVDDSYLKKRITDLARIKHVKILRIHSRLPIVLPQRITASLTDILTATPLKPVMVVHCNHANELDETVAVAIQRLWEKRITVLNQTVLLSGVNDSIEALVALNQRLFECGILPYYLHLLDKVQGAAHFEVKEEDAKILMNGLRKRLAGYLVPRLVKEQAGATCKLPIF